MFFSKEFKGLIGISQGHLGRPIQSRITAATAFGTLLLATSAAAVSAISITPSPATFPDTALFQNSKVTFTVSNNSASSATFTSISTDGSDSFIVVPSPVNPQLDCSSMTPLAPAGTCTVTVQFQPFSAGSQTGTLEVKADDANATSLADVTVPVSGFGGTTVSVTPNTANFPNTTAGSSATPIILTVNNTGTLPFTFTSNFGFVDVFHSPDFAASGQCQGATVSGGGSCTLTISFHPTVAGALSYDFLSLLANGSSGTVFTDATILATGIGLGVAPTITSGPSYTGGVVNEAYSTTVLATGTPTIQFSSMGALPPGLTLDTYTGAIAGIPTATGTYNFTLVADNGTAPAATQNASLIIGLPSITFTPNTGLTFVPQVVGSSSGTLTATVANASQTTLTLSGVSVQPGSAGFTVLGSSTCLTVGSLAPNATCTIDVNVTPTSAGSFNESIVVTTTPASNSIPSNLPLNATGLSATPTVSPSAAAFGAVDIGAAPTQTFTIYGGAGLSSLAIAVAGSNRVTVPSGGMNTCGPTLAAGATCTFAIKFNPNALGAIGATSVTVSSAAGTLATVAVTGSGQQPPASLTAGPAFGGVTVGASAAQTLTFTNNSTVSVSVSAVTVPSAPFSASPSGAVSCTTLPTLAPGGACTFDVTFAPTAVTGFASAVSVAYTSNSSSFTQSASGGATGSGTLPPTSFTPASITHPATMVSQSNVVPVTFNNNSSVSITLSAAAISSSNSAEYVLSGSGATPCANNLVMAPGTSCTMNSTFTPSTTSSPGSTYAIAFTAGAASFSRSASANGSGTAPTTSFSPATIAHGSVAVNSPNTVTGTFTNTSPVGITLGASALSSLNAQYVITGSGATPCANNLPLAPGAACTFTSTFTPTIAAPVGSSYGISFGAGSQTFSASVITSGTGVTPIAPTFSPASVPFGNALVSVPVSQTVTLTNGNVFPIKLTALANSDVRFTLAGNGGSPCNVGVTIPAGGTCTYSLTLTITGTGSLGDTVTVTYQPGGAGPTLNATQSASGNGITPPFTISPSSFSFGSVAQSSLNTTTFTFTNNSNTTAFPAPYTITTFNTTGLGFSAVGSGATPCAASLSLPAGASCTATVTLQVNPPSSTGSTNGTTTISFQTGQGANPTYTGTFSSNGTIFFVAPVITSAAPATPAALGSTYTHAFTASGSQPLIWSVATGTLPPGLSLNSSTGVLSGTPNTLGSYNFTVQAANGQLPNGTQAISIDVISPVTVINTLDSGLGSLRDAINYINANCSGQTIAFNIAGAGPFKIQPLTALPMVTCANSVIDGYTQSGSSVNTAPAGATNAVIQIWLDGTVSGGTGLSLAYSGGSQAASGSKTVRGLAITNFSIGIYAEYNAFINGNFLGVQPDGLVVAKNGTGVISQGNSFGGACCVYVGTVAPADLNLIDATGDGVAMSGNPSSTVIGNLFGLDRNGNRAAAGFGGGQAVAFYPGTFAPANAQIKSNYISNYGNLQSFQAGNSVFSQNVVVGNTHTFTATFPMYNEIEISQVTYDVSANTTNLQGNINAKDNSTTHRVEVFSNPTNTGTVNLEQYQGNIDVVPATVSLVPFGQTFMGFLANPSVTMTWLGGASTYVPLGYTRPFTVSVAPTVFNAVVGGGVTSQTLNINNTFGSPITFSAAPAVVSGTGFSITGGTCAGATIPAGGTCTVVVSYSAAAASSNTGTLDISLAVPGQQGVTTFPITTTTIYHAALSGVATASVLSLSTASLNFGSVQAGGSGTPQSVTVTNTGAVNLLVSGVALVAGGAAPSVGDFSVNSNPCPAPIAPAGTCQISVGFTPTGAGSRTAQLNILSNAATSPDAVALSGTGFTPSATLAPNPLAFGNQVFGVTSTPLTATFTNTSPIALTTTAFAIGPGFNVAGTGTCTVNGVVAPGATCTIDVTATPPSIGAFGTALTVSTSPASNSPSATVSATGVGLGPVITSGAPPAGTVSAAYSFSFAATGTPVPTWSVATGTLPVGLTLSAAGVLSGTTVSAGTYNFTVQAANGTLPNATQPVSLVIAPPPSPLLATLAFSPTTTGQNGLSTLTITLNNTGGTSVGPGSFNINYTSGLDNAASPNFTTTCPGGAGFVVSSFTTFLTYNPSGFIMPANSSCTMSVQVTPTLSNNVTLAINPGAFLMSGANGNANTATATLTVVPTPAISLSPSLLTFGSQLVGATTAAQTVIVQNNGSATANLTLPFATTGDYAVSSTTCGATLAVGASCTASVTFTPTVGAISRLGTVSLTSNTPGSPQSVNLSGTGIAVPTLAFGPSAPVAAGSTITITVSATSSSGNPQVAGVGTTLNYPAGVVNLAAAGGFPQTGCSAALGAFSAGTNSLSATGGIVPAAGGGTVTCNMMLAQVVAPTTPGNYTFTIPAGGFTLSGAVTYSNPVPINFTLVVAAAPPSVALALTPPSINTGGTSALKFTITNPTSVAATGTAFTLVYPAGVTSAITPLPSTTCGGLLTGVNSTQAAGTGMTIPALGACTVTVNVTSATPGNYNLALPAGALTSSNGLSTAAAGATLTVTSPNSPAITFAPNSLNLGSQAVGGTSATQTVTVTNSGNAALVITSIALAGDFAFSTNCPTSPSSLAVGTSCTIDVDFSPLLPGVQNSSLVVASNATNGATLSVPVTGNGTPQLVPALGFAPSALAFGNQAVGSSSAAQSVILTNGGQATLAFTSITVGGSGFLRVSSPAAGVLVPSCGATLAPAASCHVSVVLAPLAAGAQNGSIVIVHNATGSPGTVILSGNGTPRPQPLISVPASIAFGDQTVGTQSATQSINIANSGTASMTISGITLGGTNASQFSVSGNCVTTLTAGSNCSLLARFSPTVLGAQSAQLTIVSDAANTPTATVGLTGNGVPIPAPVVRLSATLLGFGNVIYGGSPATQGIVLSNVGTAPLLIQSINETGNSDFTVAAACGTSLSAGGQCNIGIAFAPHAIGARSGVLSIRSNAAGSPHTVQMGGTGCRYFSPSAARFFLTSC